MDKLILGATYLANSLIYGSLIYIFIFVFQKIMKRESEKTKSAVEYIFVIYFVTIAQVTGIANFFSWNFAKSQSINWIPLVNESPKLILLNALLFLPMGILMPLLFQNKKWNALKIAGIGGGISILIESIQLLFVGRTADIDDVIANTVGCVLGYAFYAFLKRQWNKKHAGQRIGAGSLTGAGAIVTLLFCVPLHGICLGDVLLTRYGILPWSGNTEAIYAAEGVHYTLLIGIVLNVFFMLLSKVCGHDYGSRVGFYSSIAVIMILILFLAMGL